jgi:GTPase SAR1 family protein
VHCTINLIHAVVGIFRITLDLFKFFSIANFIEGTEVTNNHSEENQQPSIQQEILNNSPVGGNLTMGNITQNINLTPPVQRPRNEKLLLQAVKDEVAARLKQSLHNAVFINLGKEAQPEQVKRPWSSDIKIGDKPSEAIPDDTSILEIFDQEEIAGKLLILGNPGAGKTTTMLDLAQALVVRSQENYDYPIPVLFNLSTWKDDKQSIQDWLVLELKSKYGVRKDIGAKWVDDAKLLPMLDGLDELKSVRQEPCVRKINELLQSDSRPLYVIICSRREEYDNYTTRLQLHGAICLRDLDNRRVQDYLLRVNRGDLWEVLQQNETLLALAQTPFWLSILVLSEQELLVGNWLALRSTEQRLECLLNAYVRQMLARNVQSVAYQHTSIPSETKIQIRLIWLAQYLQNNFSTDFLIETIQADTLPNRTQKIIYYSLILLPTFTVTVITHCYLYIMFFSSPSIAVFVGIILGLITGYCLTFSSIKFCKNVEFSLEKSLISSILTLIPGVFFSIAVLKINFPDILIYVPFFLTLGATDGFNSQDVKNRSYLNEVIFTTFKNATYGGVIGGLFFGCLCALGWFKGNFLQSSLWIILTLINISNTELNTSLNQESHNIFKIIIYLFNNQWLTGGLTGVFIGWILLGGYSLVKHFIIRVILWLNNYIPWNYARFLDYCTERLLLQRVGGRYRFIHRLLQEHFAAMSLEK